MVDITAFDELKFALAAYNDANRQANRMWSACALISLLVISFALGSEVDSIFGIKVSVNYALPISVLILSLLNISYSVFQLNAYRIAAVYQAVVKEKFGKDIPLAGNYTWFDLAQRAPVSSFNRIYPLFMPVERQFGAPFYRIIKIIYDIIFCGFPSTMIIIGLYNLSMIVQFRWLLTIVGLFSIFSTVLLAQNIISWPRSASDN